MIPTYGHDVDARGHEMDADRERWAVMGTAIQSDTGFIDAKPVVQGLKMLRDEGVRRVDGPKVVV